MSAENRASTRARPGRSEPPTIGTSHFTYSPGDSVDGFAFSLLRHSHACHTIVHRLAGPIGVGRNDWQPTSHGLKDGNAEALLMG